MTNLISELVSIQRHHILKLNFVIYLGRLKNTKFSFHIYKLTYIMILDCILYFDFSKMYYFRTHTIYSNFIYVYFSIKKNSSYLQLNSSIYHCCYYSCFQISFSNIIMRQFYYQIKFFLLLLRISFLVLFQITIFF